MDRHIHDFYRQCSDDTPAGHYHSVICLKGTKRLTWAQLLEKCPTLCRGWFELAQLSSADKIEFIREFWHSKLPFQPGVAVFLDKFFFRIDDITVYIVQPKFDDPYEAHLVYSLKDGNGFFRGHCPASESDILSLKQSFPEILFPEEYIAFLQIHNGFSKTTDTGILKANQVKENYTFLQSVIASKDDVVKCGDRPIDPGHLIPFYKSFGMPFFQCFFTEWYPRNEMGNVYYSSDENTISDLSIKESSTENLAFTTFAKWLTFYLEAL